MTLSDDINYLWTMLDYWNEIPLTLLCPVNDYMTWYKWGGKVTQFESDTGFSTMSQTVQIGKE